jgi:hypothetical protein
MKRLKMNNFNIIIYIILFIYIIITLYNALFRKCLKYEKRGLKKRMRCVKYQ